MPIHLPPLQTLRAFEAASRHLSYTRAAEELHLTHGAVSHQMKALEARLGTKLFRREGRRMLLTDEGQALVHKIRQALRLLERAFAEAVERPRGEVLTVSVLPAFAARWLIPRLAAFQEAHPAIDLNIRATNELALLAEDGVDVAIRYGPGSWPGLQQQKLMEERVFPVCSPRFRGGDLPRRPEDLARVPLLRSATQPWEPWFTAAGLDFAEPARGPAYADGALLLDAAAEGQGVALARAALVEPDLQRGRLVRLFDIDVPDVYAYYIVWRAGSAKLAAIDAFRGWLMMATADDSTARSRTLHGARARRAGGGGRASEAADSGTARRGRRNPR